MTLPLKTPPKSICLLRLSAIGDVTHIVPIIRNLQRSWPTTAITWIIGKGEHTLVSDIKGIEFIVFDKKKSFSSYRKLYKKINKRQFDLLLHMQVSLRASFVSLFVRSPIRVGFDHNRAKNWQWLFTNQKIAKYDREHVLDCFLKFTQLIGVEPTPIEWDIPIPEAANEKINDLVGTTQSVVVINPSSSNRANNWRNWDPKAYAQIAEYVVKQYGHKVILTGGPAEQEINFATTIANLAQVEIFNLVGKTRLKELLALLHRASLVISPDTGPAHMANAVGIPVIGLYASSNPERTGPYNSLDLTINCYPKAVEKYLGKKVNEISWGKRVRVPQVMDLIQPKDVIKKIDIVLGQSR